MRSFVAAVLFLQYALLSQVSGKCTEEQLKQIHDCRGGEQFFYVYNFARHKLAGSLLPNLTETMFTHHCELLTKYNECVSKVPDSCHTLIQSDTTFQGVWSYYKFVCGKSYIDYAEGYECREEISHLQEVQTCDKQAEQISLVPGNYNGACGNITQWLQCYTKATSKECSETQSRRNAVYVMTAQYHLVRNMAEAAKCQGQDFQKYSAKYSESNTSSGSGWIHAVWISLLIICLVTGVLIYMVYRKRVKGIPRQRLVNENENI